MAHYAQVVDGVVTQVIVADQSFIDTLEGKWVQTSYNTRRGVHYGADGKPDGKSPLRANYAYIGCHYSEKYDIFHDPCDPEKGKLNYKTGQCYLFTETIQKEPILDTDKLDSLL